MQEYFDFNLKTLSAWRIGGRGRHLLRPESVSEFAALLKRFKVAGQRYLVVGNGSNIFFSDEGLDCPVIQLSELNNMEIDNRSVYAETGVWVPRLAMKAMRAGLTGFEHVCGIPGTVGGLICMNGGSMRQSISDYLSSVRYIDLNGDLATMAPNDGGFKYRTSIFQQGDRFVVDAKFELAAAADSRVVKREMVKILKSRRKKFPRKTFNCGSVFKSDARMFAEFGPPGKLIESLNLKGHTVGGAKISELHGNFFTNEGGATSEDMLALIRTAYVRVLRDYGVAMQPEVRYVTKQGDFLNPVNF